MSVLDSFNLASGKDSDWGTFWDTHIGREGFFGNLGGNFLWKSGTVRDAEERARKKIKDIYEDAIGDTEDYMTKIENYYQGEGGLLERARTKTALTSGQTAMQLQNLEDTMYTKGDMANIQKTDSPNWGSNIYTAAEIGMSNSILGQKYQMNQQVFNLEEKIKQLEMGREDRLNQIG